MERQRDEPRTSQLTPARSAASPSSTSSAVHARVGASAPVPSSLTMSWIPQPTGICAVAMSVRLGSCSWSFSIASCAGGRRHAALASRRWDGRAGGQERRREGADEEGGGGWEGEEGEGRGALRVHLILGGGKEQHPEHHDEPAGAQQRDRRVHVLAVQRLVRVERDEVERATLGGKLLEVGERRPREHRRAVAEELVEERCEACLRSLPRMSTCQLVGLGDSSVPSGAALASARTSSGSSMGSPRFVDWMMWE